MALYNISPYLVKAEPMPYVINYEKMSKDYDFLYVPKDVQEKHKMSVFMGFDVETGLFLNPTFEALDDREFELFKQQYAQQQKENEALLRDPDIQNILLALSNHETTEDKAQAILKQKLRELKGR